MPNNHLTPGLKQARILIVDDQEDNITLLETFLADEGYSNVQSAQDPRRALPLYQSIRPDLVLLDLHMPHLDGFAVLEQLRPCIADEEYVPILVLTADIRPEVRSRALSGGARDYLSKPLDFDEVSARIRNLLETRILHLQLHERRRSLEEAVSDLQAERELSERLLLNVLPRSIAEQLKRGGGVIAESFPEATVLFADIEDFSKYAASVHPAKLVTLLNQIFSRFDELAEKHGLEKIKTIGDAYMVVGGLPQPRQDHAQAVAEMGIEMQQEIARFNRGSGRPFCLRIGINTGPVVAGVIGSSKFAYDLWGDTVNLASRMESHGIAGAIQVTEETYLRLRSRYTFEPRGEIPLRNRGPLPAYLLTGRLTPESS